MKTTKVVLTGDEAMDQYIKAAMKNIWVLSPFEFCSRDEFNAIKGSQDYYFMALTKTKHKKEAEANTVMLDVVKGGTGDQIENMLEVVKFPVCTADSSYHRLDAFLPAIVNLMQNYIKRGLYSNFSKIKPNALSKVSHKIVFIAADDVTAALNEKIVKDFADDNIVMTETANADQMFIDGADALISYTIAPLEPQKGSVCYKMLFDARSYEMYYYTSHVIKGKKGRGFLKSDIHKIANSR